MNPETKIELDAVDLIWQWLGIKGIKLKAVGNNGYPDRLFLLPGGKPLLIEFKQPGGKPEPLQQQRIDELKELGYEVQVHTSAVDAFEAVIKIMGTKKLSKESRQVLARARGRCAVLRSRSR